MGGSWITTLLLFADDAAPEQAPPPSLFSPQMLLTMWLPIGLLFYFFLIRPQNKERSKQANMLRQLKENDRVVTVGGIYGVVTNVHREADEVTIRVDEKNNTRLRVTLGAISRVLADQAKTDESSAK
jgi:preprotein translocase subunit YajC